MLQKFFSVALIVFMLGIVGFSVLEHVQKSNAEEMVELFATSSINEGYELIPVDEEQFIEGNYVSYQAGSIPPNFELETLKGDRVQLSDLHGKKVILNFWASWCGPCKEEMPELQNFYDKYAEDLNVEILAVNLTTEEFGRNVDKTILQFAEEYNLTFPILLDRDGHVSDQFHVLAIPTTYIIAPNGIISEKVIGPLDVKMLKEILK